MRRPENGSLGELDKREVSKHRWWANVGSSQKTRDVAGKETVRLRFRGNPRIEHEANWTRNCTSKQTFIYGESGNVLPSQKSRDQLMLNYFCE